MPKSWSVVLSADGKMLPIATAQPTYQAVGTPPGGLDLEAVYVGMASEADLCEKLVMPQVCTREPHRRGDRDAGHERRRTPSPARMGDVTGRALPMHHVARKRGSKIALAPIFGMVVTQRDPSGGAAAASQAVLEPTKSHQVSTPSESPQW